MGKKTGCPHIDFSLPPFLTTDSTTGEVVLSFLLSISQQRTALLQDKSHVSRERRQEAEPRQQQPCHF